MLPQAGWGRGEVKTTENKITFTLLGHIHIITLLIFNVLSYKKKMKSFLILFPLNFGQNNPQRGIDWSNRPQFLVRLSL